MLVGPSGSGKTTALRMLAGLESISEGEIRIGERVVNRVAPRERDIAMVFQDYALYPQMTVYDNLAFALRRRKTPKDRIDEQVRRAAGALELDALLERKPRQLSGGQQQRVALGRALVRDPVVFLMDEPLSNLDAKLRVQTRGEIKRLQKEIGTTTVYVTHDQVEAMTMGDRIAVMNHGRLEQVGTPAELYDEPANVFVAGFVGSPGHELRARRRLGLDLRARGDDRRRAARSTRGRGQATACSARSTAQVEYVEALGRETFLGVRHDEETRSCCASRGARRPSRATASATGSSATACASSTPRAAAPARPDPADTASPDTLAPVLSIELAVATPAFLDLTFVGLETLPAPGEERFAGELLRSPGGGAITAVAAARLGLQTALVAPLGHRPRRRVRAPRARGRGRRRRGLPHQADAGDGRDAGGGGADDGHRRPRRARPRLRCRGAHPSGDRRQPRPARPAAERDALVPDLRRRRRAGLLGPAPAEAGGRAGALPQRAGRARADQHGLARGRRRAARRLGRSRS